jgi:hypothetical protein
MADIADIMFGPAPQKKPKGPEGPSFVKRRAVDPGEWFELAPMWDHLAKQLQNAPSGGPIRIPVQKVTDSGLSESQALAQAAYFFGRERTIVGLDTSAAWSRILDDVEAALNSLKPKELPGRMRFDVSDDSALTLFYTEK